MNNLRFFLLSIIIQLSYLAFCQTVNWSKSPGNPNGSIVQAFAETEDGGFLIYGSRYNGSDTIGIDTMLFFSDSLFMMKSKDHFLAKFDSQGNLIWTKKISTNQGAPPYVANNGRIGYALGKTGGISTANNSIYITGNTNAKRLYIGEDSIDIDVSDTLYGNQVLLKLDINGKPQWSVVESGTMGNVEGALHCVSSDGSIILSGLFKDSIQFNGQSIYNDLGIYVARFSSAGQFMSMTSGTILNGNSQNFQLTGIAEMNGAIYLTGNANNINLEFGSHIISSGNNDLILTKLDIGNNFIWAKQFANNTNGSAKAWTLGTQNGSLYFGGECEQAQFGDFLIEEKVSFVAKCNENGEILWAKKIPVMDKMAHLSFNSNGLFTVNLGEGFSAHQIDFNGNEVWRYENTSNLNVGIIGITSDNAGGVTVVGDFYGYVNFSLFEAVVASPRDYFIANISPPPAGFENQLDHSIDLLVYPNPTTDNVQIRNKAGSENSDFLVYVMDVNGKTLLQKNINPNTNPELSLSNFIPGIYLIRIHSDNEYLGSVKIIKQ